MQTYSPGPLAKFSKILVLLVLLVFLKVVLVFIGFYWFIKRKHKFFMKGIGNPMLCYMFWGRLKELLIKSIGSTGRRLRGDVSGATSLGRFPWGAVSGQNIEYRI